MKRTAIFGIALLASVVCAATEASPPRIQLNQVGFESAGPKVAVIAAASPTSQPWRLQDASGKTLARGRTIVFGYDKASDALVHRVDFSSYRATGRGFRIVVGRSVSDRFNIKPRPYADLASDALSFFYQQRSSEPIAASMVQRADLARPAGHPRELVTCFKGVDLKGVTWPGCDYKLDVTGGWYDAGDHGKYVVNGGLSAWTLLDLAARLAGAGRPDRAKAVRDEARVEVEFLLRMQIPENTQLETATVASPSVGATGFQLIDAGGLAHAKVADERWTGLPTAPNEDREKRWLYPPTTAATLNLSAVAARASRLWTAIDPAFAARCIAAARRAWGAAERYPRLPTFSDFAGSGGYGDATVSDERFWAASELFAATGEAAYLDVVESSEHLREPGTDLGWSTLGLAGVISLSEVSGPAQSTAKATLVRTANAYMGERLHSGYRLPYASADYPWGSNGMLLNRALVLGVVANQTHRPEYRAAEIDVVDYVLGRNPLGRSYVTGYGSRPMRNPHHRFWASSIDTRYPDPPPGVLSGGPNSDRQDGASPECTGQTCWVDRAEAFTMNEVAINWNAPLLWVVALLDAEPTTDLVKSETAGADAHNITKAK